MNSDQFESRLNELLDRRIAPDADPEVMRAAEQFASCRSLMGAYRAVVDGVVAMETPRPPADLADQVMRQWRREKVANRCRAAQHRVVKRGTSRQALFAAAAALLIASPALGWLWRQASDTDGQPIAATAGKASSAVDDHAFRATDGTEHGPIAKVASVPMRTPDTVRVADAGPDAASVATSDASEDSTIKTKPENSATRGVDEMASLLGPPHDAIDGSLGETPPAAEGAAWVGEVSEGFQPIAESAAGALDFLLEVLADGSDGSRG
ncbi:MAG: hypothetical protein AB7U73_09320 [Pirellulales bacterium]